MIGRRLWMPRPFQSFLVVLIFSLASTALAQEAQPTNDQQGEKPSQQTSDQQPVNQQSGDSQLPGSISGVVVDGTGAAIAGARITLTREDKSQSQQATSDADGQFSFASVAPGPFQLQIASAAFATQTSSGILHSGEMYTAPQITLAVAPEITEVQVVLPRVQVAEEEIKEQEKQRVLGFIPNFYVSYVPNAAPLNSRQKFELAWKTSLDPATFGIIGGIAGVQQATNQFGGYGQGAAGYGKRYGAAYGDLIVGTFIGSAILPSLLKQDPRYFYKGSGSTKSRILYAIANSVICKGDNGHWQANYSNILGSLAAGGISNLYYPSEDRNGAALTFESALIGIGASSAVNVFEELIVRKLTPNLPNRVPAKP